VESATGQRQWACCVFLRSWAPRETLFGILMPAVLAIYLGIEGRREAKLGAPGMGLATAGIWLGMMSLTLLVVFLYAVAED
jgi:hypothetical protein